MVQIKHFTAPQIMPNFQFSSRAKWPWRDKILGAPPPPARPEIYCESKQIYFSYSLAKAFHSPEFYAKLFLTRNWVCGFYWDSLLKANNIYSRRRVLRVKCLWKSGVPNNNSYSMPFSSFSFKSLFTYKPIVRIQSAIVCFHNNFFETVY